MPTVERKPLAGEQRHTPLFPALGTLRQNREFENNEDYIHSTALSQEKTKVKAINS